MPVAIIANPQEWPRATREDIAQRVTEAISSAAGVLGEKVQVFFLPATVGRSAVPVDGQAVVLMVGDDDETRAGIADRLRAIGFDQVSVIGHPPDHTARGGVLRFGGAE